MLDTRTVVPATVKQHDLTGRRKVRHITLKVPLCFFPVTGCRQRHGTHHPRIQSLRNALDDAAFTRRVAPFKKNNHAVARMRHPILQFNEFALQTQQLTEIRLTLQQRLLFIFSFTLLADFIIKA